jgi:hypothetical protein
LNSLKAGKKCICREAIGYLWKWTRRN